MSPDLSDDHLRQLLEAGLSQREIARRTGMPRATVQRHLTRLGLQVTPAPQAPTRAAPHPPAPTRESPAMTFIAVAEVQEILSTLKRLDARVEALEHTRMELPAPTHEAPRIPAPTRAGVQQWTVRLSGALIEILKAEAEKERLQPSHLLEAIILEWWETRKRSTPASNDR